jgi:glycosyltransferase involved in cell wall biosynthesis
MSPEKPLFSIICTTFNRQKLLLRAVNSVLRQQFEDFELIIINDGSNDDTSSVVKTIHDRRIVYLEHTKNRGLNAARNTGIMKAKGKLLAFLDDDDELAESALQMAQETYRSLNNERLKMLIFNCVDSETGIVSGVNLGKKAIVTFQDLLCQKMRGDHWIVVDRDILPKNRVFDERAWGTAGTLWISLLRSYDAYYVPEIAYYAYRRHGMQRLTNFEATMKNSKMWEYDISELLREFGAEMKCSCPKIYSKKTTELAFHQLINKNFRAARSNLLMSMHVHFSFYAFGLFFLSLLGNQEIVFSVYRINRLLCALN